MQHHTKYTYVFDIDETILSVDLEIINKVKTETSEYDPYEGYFGACYALNKDDISKCFKDILDHDDEIAFITRGSITKNGINHFCYNTLGVTLPKNFRHYNLIDDKTPKLDAIKGNRKVSDIIFVDNSMSHIKPAKDEGFRTIYADNNNNDPTNGTEYISKIIKIIQERNEEILKKNRIILKAANSALDQKGLLNTNHLNLIKNNKVLQKAVIALDQEALLDTNHLNLIKNNEFLQKAVIALDQVRLLGVSNFNLIKNNKVLPKAVIALEEKGLLDTNHLDLIKNNEVLPKAVIALDKKRLLDDNNFNLIKNNKVLQKAVIALDKKGLLNTNHLNLIKNDEVLQKAVIALNQEGLLDDINLNLIKNDEVLQKAVIALNQDGLLVDKFELIKDKPELQDAVIPLEQNLGVNRQILDNQNSISSKLMCQAIETIQDGMTSRNNRKYRSLNFVATYCDLHNTVSDDLAKKVIQTALQRRGWGGGETASGQALVNYLNSNEGRDLKNALFPNKDNNVEYSDLRKFCNKKRNELRSGNKENLYREYSVNNVIDQRSVNEKMKSLNYTI